MSKASEARVRDELLQSLYAATLRCTLSQVPASAPAIAAARADQAAIAAGVCANLRPHDLLLLPRHGAAGFRVLRGLGRKTALPASDLAAGILTLPPGEAQAVSFALGAAAAATHASAQTSAPGGPAQSAANPLVCVVLPRLKEQTDPAGRTGLRRDRGALSNPQTWPQAAAYAARVALPLLLVADRLPRPAAAAHPAHRTLAPPFPTIPVDRDDALAIYRVAFECAARARAGLGPSLLACVPFRVAGEPPQPSAVARLEAMLRRRGAFHKAWHRRLERLLVRELAG